MCIRHLYVYFPSFFRSVLCRGKALEDWCRTVLMSRAREVRGTYVTEKVNFQGREFEYNFCSFQMQSI